MSEKHHTALKLTTSGTAQVEEAGGGGKEEGGGKEDGGGKEGGAGEVGEREEEMRRVARAAARTHAATKLRDAVQAIFTQVSHANIDAAIEALGLIRTALEVEERERRRFLASILN